MFKLIPLVFALALPFAVFGLDEEAAKEKQCDVPSPSVEQVGLDKKWMDSINTFYVPLWSKFQSQRIASELLQKDVSDIKDEEINGRPMCALMQKGNIVSGLGRARLFNLTFDSNAMTFKALWEDAKAGKFSYHLTDNKNFILGITCWEDNQSNWGVFSTTPYLEPAIRKRIIKYVTSLGFKEEMAVDESYVGCPLGGYPLLTNTIVPVVQTRYVYTYPSYSQVYRTFPFATLPTRYYKKK